MDDRFVRELLADHSRNPRHYGELPAPDIEAETENPQCVGPTHPEGDWVGIAVTLSDGDPPAIDRVRFTGAGCTLSQATASLLTQEMIGASVADVVEWDGERLEELVGMELTPSRLKCAELALVAFRKAMEDHETADDISAG
jgi:nitrogen fixation NifU-like protein